MHNDTRGDGEERNDLRGKRWAAELLGDGCERSRAMNVLDARISKYVIEERRVQRSEVPYPEMREERQRRAS